MHPVTISSTVEGPDYNKMDLPTPELDLGGSESKRFFVTIWIITVVLQRGTCTRISRGVYAHEYEEVPNIPQPTVVQTLPRNDSKATPCKWYLFPSLTRQVVKPILTRGLHSTMACRHCIMTSTEIIASPSSLHPLAGHNLTTIRVPFSGRPSFDTLRLFVVKGLCPDNIGIECEQGVRFACHDRGAGAT